MVNPNRFYTYAYLREDRTPYYIGKGCGKRIYKKYKGEIHPPRDKSRILLLKTSLTEEEAFRHEIYMIYIFGRKNLGTGVLHNRTNGGDGSSGRIVSQEEIIKQRKVGKKCVKNKTGIHGCNEEFMRISRMKGSIKSKETCSRNFKVKDLSGNVIEGKNVTEFCRKFGYGTGNFLQMLYGKQKMAYGYVLPETKITYYKIISPEGKEYIITNFDKFHKFCEEHNLSQSGLGRMLKGKISHRGWKLLNTFYR
jgi:hypothetical protein